MIYFKKINNIILFKLSDSLTINETERGWRCFDDILKQFPVTIAVDLSDVTSIDSAGIGFLVKIYKKTTIYGIELIFIGMTDSMQRLFDITGLFPFFNFMTKKEFENTVEETDLYESAIVSC